MSSIEEVRAELETARTTLNQAPYFGILRGLAAARTVAAEASVYEGVAALMAISQLLPAYVTDAYKAKEKAGEGRAQISAAAEDPDGTPPPKLVADALAGASAMSTEADTITIAVDTMDSHLNTALGHLAAFTASMQLYDQAWETAAGAAQDGFRAQRWAIDSTDAYIRQIS
ncbi:MAG TPA: hypothetical protein VLH86_01110 [Patescibacteria group bacterium]|nr:hypothetical protein [Patescibacteria group bacterium]